MNTQSPAHALVVAAAFASLATAAAQPAEARGGAGSGSKRPAASAASFASSNHLPVVVRDHRRNPTKYCAKYPWCNGQ